MTDWLPLIGLEVHARTASKSKLFSLSKTTFGAEPNAQAGDFDLALPGTLPVCEMECVDKALDTALALNMQIPEISIFERKSYSYPDLPHGFQITQHRKPLAKNGSLEIPGGRTIRIHQLHLEQDAGKLVRDPEKETIHIDYNRSGCGLMEIVTEPDLHSAEEVSTFLKTLREILLHIRSSTAIMQEGEFRADVNVSLSKDREHPGTRCEIKNLNSMRFIRRAIEHEIFRQSEILESGGTVKQQTRLFDPKSGTTTSMRSKEEAHDYRYFPEPDLEPLKISKEYLEERRTNLPELPAKRRERYLQDYPDLPKNYLEILVAEPETGEYLEDCLAEQKQSPNPKKTAIWMINHVFGLSEGRKITEIGISPKDLAKIIGLEADSKITIPDGRKILEILQKEASKLSVLEIATRENLLKEEQSQDLVLEAVRKVISTYPEERDRIAKKPTLLQWFVGQVMKETRGKADPKIVQEILKQELGV